MKQLIDVYIFIPFSLPGKGPFMPKIEDTITTKNLYLTS